MSDGEAVKREWRAAEERLYPVASVRPDLYEVCINLVRSLAEYLERVPDVDALVTTYRNSTAEHDFTEAGVDLDSIPPEVELDMVRAAGYQMYERKVSQREAVERTRDEIRRAESRGEQIATIWAEGQNEMWPPYRRVRMSLKTGYAVAMSTQLNPSTLTPVFALDAVALDPETGDATDEPALTETREFTDPSEWHAAAEELGRRLLT